MDTDPAVRDRTLKLPVFQLVYISAPKEDWTGEALKNLLEQCRDRNRGLGISGLLLYRPGMFMQVLEGDEADVRRVYADIESDSRHQDVTLISSGRVPLRRFENWSMAFRDLRDPTLIGKQGFSEFLNMPMVAIPFLLQPSRLEELLLAFRANLNEGV